MKSVLKGAVFAAVCFAAAAAQENYSTWSHTRTLTLNTAATGANVASTQVRFPVLVRLTAADSQVFVQSRGRGADVRFVKPNGARLPHHVELWDSAGRNAAIWVLADTVKGSDSTMLRMYWGKAGAGDSARASAVFDSSNGFRGVWHLGDSTGGVSRDASPFNTDAQWINSPVLTNGIIGRAVNLQNPSGITTELAKYLSAPYDTATQNFRTSSAAGVTLSAWINRNSGSNGANETVIAGRYNWPNNKRHVAIGTNGNGNTIKLWRSVNGQGGGSETSFGSVVTTSGQWYHVVATVKNGAQELYVNGVLDATQNTASVGSLDSIWADIPFAIGRMAPLNTNSAHQSFNGIVDEVRLANLTRSADWVKLEYENQRAGQTLVKAGAITAVATPPSGLAYAVDSAVYIMGSPIAQNVPTVTGVVDSFTVSPALPAGLALQKVTGIISGTPTAAAAIASYTVTAHNASGTTTKVLRIAVSALSAPSAFTYKVNPAVFTAGVAIVPDTAVVTGTVDSFTVAPALPAGLTLNKTTGIITGTPSAASPATVYTVTARNASGAATVQLSIRVQSPAEDYGTWTYHRNITINTTTSGANIAGNLVNFPLLVRIGYNERDVVVYSKANGADLRFTKADGVTPLPYQIERWDTVARRADVWVRIDTVKGNNATQSFRMYWGKDGVSDRSEPAEVFPTDNGYVAVWHQNQASAPSLDATSNGNHALWAGTAVGDSGIIGRARKYNVFADGDYDTVAVNSTFNMSTNDRVTVSAWVRRLGSPASGDAFEGIAGLFDWTRNGTAVQNRSFDLVHHANNGFSFHVSTNGQDGSNETIVSTGVTADDGWYHVAGTVDGTAINVYINGVAMASSAFTGNIHFPSNLAGVGPFTIGRMDDNGSGAGQYFVGLIDEVRVSRVARSPEWLKLSYETQKANASAVVYGASTPSTPPIRIAGAARSAAGAFSVTRSGEGFRFALPAGAEDGKVSLMTLDGKVVWTSAVAAGSSTLLWNGAGRGGEALASGLYLARFTRGKTAHEARVLIAP